MWSHVESSSIEDKALDLYEDAGVYMIRVDGWELMNGKHHRSEDILGVIAAGEVQAEEQSVLIGGLGLGYTLASFLKGLAVRPSVTVAELSGDVLEWFWARTSHAALHVIPQYVRFLNCDVSSLLGDERRWDVIVLDVDNGPRALSKMDNATLYDHDGLRALHRALRSGGKALVWSGFEDEEFAEHARSSGFGVEVISIDGPDRRDPFHFIFSLSRSD